MFWVNPSKKIGTSQLLPYSPHSGIKERIEKVKVRKLMSGNKDILIDKRKAMCARKRKQRIDQYLPFNRLMFSHLLESMASSCLMVNWEDKHGNSECLLPPSLT